MSRQQFRRWGAALSAGLLQGLAGPAVGLLIQAQLPAHAGAGSLPTGTPDVAPRANRGTPLKGVPS